MTLRLATGPVCWGVDFADAPGNPPWPGVLDGIAKAGYRHVELGPYGYLPADPARLREALAGRGLAMAGGFVFEPLHDPSRRRNVVAAAERVCALVAPAGGSYLVVIDAVSRGRAAAAGRSPAARRLDRAGRRALHTAIREVAEVAVAHGLAAAVHPHAGTHIEFADEIGAVAEVAPLCVDTGHCAWAGVDPEALLQEMGDRVACLHLKDVDPRVRDRGLAFWDAIAAGIFCPLGSGMVDLHAVVSAAGDRLATVEQDRVPGTGDPVADLVTARRALERAGLFSPAEARR